MPFQKGNKLGTGAKEKPWTRALEKHAKQNPDKLAVLAEKTFAMALEGDPNARREIGDRLDGKPVQATELTGKDGGPLQFENLSESEIDTRLASLMANVPMMQTIKPETEH